MSPFFFFGIVSGAVADKVNRRKLMIMMALSKGVCAFILGTLTTMGWISLWNVYLLSFFMGTFHAFDMTTRQVFVFDTVGPENAMNALSMNSVGTRTVGIIGGVLSGIIIRYWAINWCYYIMVLASLLAALALFPIKGLQKQKKGEVASTWTDVVEGLRILRTNRIVLFLAIIAIGCEIFGFSFNSILPVFARDILIVGATGLGMLTATESIGGVLMALILASLGNYEYKGRLILGILAFFAIFLLMFSASPWFPVSLVLCGFIGAMCAGMDALQQITLQMNVANEQRGRAMGIWLFSIGFGPVGHFVLGGMASLFGGRLALGINGTTLLVIFLIALVFIPKLRAI
jgi:MFS family permease